VLDWNWEFCADGILCDANEGYIVAYLEGVMATMAQSCLDLPKEASDFLADGELPSLDVSTLLSESTQLILNRTHTFMALLAPTF